MLYKESAWRCFVCRGELVLTSFQQQTDALGVVDLDAVTAGQGVQQGCLSCSGRRQIKKELHLKTLPEAAPCSLQEHPGGYTHRFCRLH